MADATTGSVNHEALRRAIDSLSLQDLALRKTSVDVHEDCILGVDGARLQVQLKWGADEARLVQMNPGTPQLQTLLIVEVTTSMRLVDKPAGDSAPGGEAKVKAPADNSEPSGDAKVKALIEVTYVAKYRVNEGAELEQEAIDEFATKNAIYHVWPYWREYLSTTLARAHLPPFTLPMFVLRKAASEVPSQASLTETAEQR